MNRRPRATASMQKLNGALGYRKHCRRLYRTSRGPGSAEKALTLAAPKKPWTVALSKTWRHRLVSAGGIAVHLRNVEAAAQVTL